jgi:hypothetical protein
MKKSPFDTRQDLPSPSRNRWGDPISCFIFLPVENEPDRVLARLIEQASEISPGLYNQQKEKTMKRLVSIAVLAALSTGVAVGAERVPAKPMLSVAPQMKAAALTGKRPLARPDITSGKGGIIIGGGIGGAGGKFVPWGSTADLTDMTPLPGTTGPGTCAFNATYIETNPGGAATSPLYTNKLRVGGTVVAINSARQLNAGQTKSVTTQPYLKEGMHGLALSLDDGNVVAESKETNNKFSIRYKLKCKSGEGQNKADLVPVLSHPMTGTVHVKNIGTAGAGPSKLVLRCKKTMLATSGNGNGNCADIPKKYKAAYNDPAFPDAVTVKVPALAAGAIFSHTFPFWSSLVWTSGNYQITGMADAAHTVPESNETNNAAATTLSVP